MQKKLKSGKARSETGNDVFIASHQCFLIVFDLSVPQKSHTIVLGSVLFRSEEDSYALPRLGKWKNFRECEVMCNGRVIFPCFVCTCRCLQ